MILSDIVTGETAWSDVAFLAAAIVSALAVIAHYMKPVPPWLGALMALSVMLIALGLLFL